MYAEIIEGTKSGQDNSGLKVKGVIHWVDKKTCVDLTAKLYDYLLDDDKTGKDFSERLNKNSLTVCAAKGEKFLGSVGQGESFQFLRQGYFVRDIKSDGLVFNRIVGLKDTFNTKK